MEQKKIEILPKIISSELCINECSNDVKIISVEKIGKGTIRTLLEIKGYLFKRLSHPLHGVIWNDEEGTFNDCLDMSKKQEEQLENIFQAFVYRNKTIKIQ